MSINKSFIIPSDHNKISKRDINKRQIRITVAFSHFFPQKSGKIKVIIENEYECTFSYCGDRSHILRLGKNAATELGLKAGDSVKFIVMQDKVFKLEKI